MAVPVFQAVGTAATGAGASVSFGWPTHAAGDIGLLILEASGTDPTVTPAGWAHVCLPVVDVASTAGSKLMVLWKRAASSSEASVSITATDHLVGRISTWRGCVATGWPFDAIATSVKTTASTGVTLPAVTTGTIDTRVVLIASRPNDLSGTTSFGAPTNAALTGLVEHFEAGTASGNGGGFSVGSGAKAESGSTGTTSLTGTVSTTNACITLALASENPALSAFSGGVAGAFYRPEPLSSFQVSATDSAVPAGYNNLFGRWLDSSGNANDLTESDDTLRPYTTEVDGLKAAYIYDPAQAAGGAGASSAFYLCIAFDSNYSVYYGTVYSDKDTANTGFELVHNPDQALDFRFSVGTGTARVTAAVSSGAAPFSTFNGRILLEAWYDGSKIYLSLNRGSPGQASVPSVAVGRPGFTLTANSAGADKFQMKIFMAVLTKNSLPSDALRTKIAVQAAARGQIAIAANTPVVSGAMAATESGADAFAAVAGQPPGNTNLLFASEAMDDIAWTAGVTPVVAVNVSNDIDGLPTVDELTVNGSGSAYVRQHLTGLTIGQKYTLSAWVQQGRSGSAVATLLTTNNNSAWNTGSTTKAVLTSELVRVSTTWTQTGTTFAAVMIGATNASGGGDPDGIGTVRISRVMLNTGSAPGVYPSSGSVAVNGSLAAAESGQDAASAAVTVAISGLLAASEAGVDALASTGQIKLSGALGVTETGADSASATGQIAVAGALTSTEAGVDSASFAGQIAVAGALAATEVGTDSASATGQIVVTGALTSAETGADAAAGAGQVAISGALASSETAADTAAATGLVAIAGAVASSEAGADTMTSTGSIALAGSMTASEAGVDTFAASGGIVVPGTLAVTESATDAFAASGKVLLAGVMVVTESGSDSMAGTVRITLAGSMAASETGFDGFSAAVGIALAGALSVSESGQDAFAASALVVVAGPLQASEDNDTFGASGNVPAIAMLAAQEAGEDYFGAEGVFVINGVLDAQEAPDVAGFTVSAPVTGSMNVSEGGGDTFAGSGLSPALASAAMAETGRDTFAGAASLDVQAQIAAIESGSDTAQGAGQVRVTGDMAVSEESPDVFYGSTATTWIGQMTAQEEGLDGFAAVMQIAVTGAFSAADEEDAAEVQALILVGALMHGLELRDTAQIAGHIQPLIVNLTVGAVAGRPQSNSATRTPYRGDVRRNVQTSKR